MRSWKAISMLLLIGSSLTGCVATHPVSTRTLLPEMTDLNGMASFPDPPYTCRQFSSYDRRSKTPDQHDDWFANNDYNQYPRIEERDGRQEHVMMDAEGPGAIVRIWSPNPKGTLRLYLDHGQTPALEAPMADLLGGKVAGLPIPLAGQRSRGWNLYFPIPYARHCKVTGDEGGSYYHINYRTYPAGTKAVTFDPAELEALAAEIINAATRLALPEQADPRAADVLAAVNTGPLGDGVEIDPGKSVSTEISTSDPLAIVELRVKVDADDLEPALRKLLFKMEFDGELTVACPLGDFFGAPPGINPYASLPLGVTEDGELWSRWVMPFRENLRLEVHNLGGQPARVRVNLSPAAREWTPDSMYFHAGWRVARDVPTRPYSDWNYVTIQGQGVFAGAAFAIANPTKHWWGEGDEKIYVDGEEFPSHFGTGTEDYFGYGWCCNVPFSHAYHNQPRCDGPGNHGRTAVNRWHILDRIPFQSSFRFDMELWHWWDGKVPEMSVVTYWYGRPGAASNCPAPSLGDLRLVTVPPYVAPRVAGALEGEELTIVRQAGTPAPQAIGGCSNDHHLWWRDGRPSDRLVLSFPAPAAGEYRVHGRFVKARDYGKLRFYVNDRSAGEAVDFFNDGVAVSDEMLLGVFTLLPEGNLFAAEIVGANEKADQQYMFGLDYLRLDPAE